VRDGSLVASVGQAIDPRGVIQRITDRTLELLGSAEGVMVGLADASGVTYVCGAGSQVDDVGTRVGLDDSLSGLAVRTGAVQLSHDTALDHRVDAAACRRLAVVSLVCVPMVHGDETIGVVAVNATIPHAFGARDVEVLTRLGNFISVAVGSAFDLFQVCTDLLDLTNPVEAGGHDAGRYVMSVLNPESVDRIDGEQRIRNVMDDPTALSMAFQPIVELASGSVFGYEALARFNVHPYRTPDVWFHEAHDHQLGVALERLAVSRAAAQIPLLPGGAVLTLNAGPETVMNPEFVEDLLDIPYPGLVLELTEHTKFDDYAALESSLRELRAHDIGLAIDDTGSGYSGLSHILRLAPDFIKLDRELVSGIDVDPVRRVLAASLVMFADDTGARIVAEGVEYQGELDVLRDLGVDFAQGYLLGRPATLPTRWAHPVASGLAPVEGVSPASPR
jgi:EAL domain-containing protein (putative c-di-GMP-specific phosphodiesterase class I)